MRRTMEDKVYYFYTDGATSKNGSENAIGGWAWIRAEYENDVMCVCNGKAMSEDNTTNNRCELLAVIDACEFAEEKGYKPAVFYTDSAYIINCYNDRWYENWIYNGWVNYKREPVKNRDLWEKLIPYFRGRDFDFQKVKGHSGIRENEIVDEMAKNAILGAN